MTGPDRPPGPDGEPPAGLSDMPESPLTAMGVGAAGMHVLFLGFVEGGFTSDQALHIVTAIIVDMSRRGGGA